MTTQCGHGQLARSCLLREMRDENIALRAKLADCQAVIRERGHVWACPALMCGKCGFRQHASWHEDNGVPDDWCIFEPKGPCSDACGHDRTTGEKV